MANVSDDRRRAARLLIRVEQGAFASRWVDGDPAPGVRSRVLGVLRWQRRLDHRLEPFLKRPLAPFDPERSEVRPFARAIHLKNLPPGVSSLPPGTVDTGPSLCVPAETLPGGFARAPRSLHTLIFLAPAPRPAEPTMRELGPGEAVSRLFANTAHSLNNSFILEIGDSDILDRKG